MVKIFPLKIGDETIFQGIYNNKDIIQHLGGFTHLESISGKIKQTGTTIFGATVDGEPAGSIMIASRNQCHYAKFGEVGVLSKFRKKRIATALYSAVIFQGIIEGRRIWEDTIVGNNPFQPHVLPTLGIQKWGTLKKKTASFLDIDIWGINLDETTVIHLLKRIPSDFEITIIEDFYTRDLIKKNMEIYEKKNRPFIEIMEDNQTLIYNSINVLMGQEKPEHNSGKKKNQDQANLF